MAKFSFDESQSIEVNLESFYNHLEDTSNEFAGILRRELPQTVAGTQDRTAFHTTLASLLDACPQKKELVEPPTDDTESEEPDNEEVLGNEEAEDCETEEPKRYYLTELRVEGFRGINNEGEPLTLKFDADKVNSIYAENGFGKSSLFDALSFAIRGSIPKLDRLEGKENARDYYNNRFHTKQHAKIELTFADDQNGETSTVTVERDKEGIRTVSSVDMDEPETFLMSLRNDFLFLDQATFERFIRDPSQERGQCFTRLLGLSALADYTATFKKLADNRNLSADLETPRIRNDKTRMEDEKLQLSSRLRDDYDNLIGEQITGEIDVSSYESRVLKALQGIQVIAPLCQVKKLSDIKFDKLQTAIKTAETGKLQLQLTANQGTIKALDDLTEAEGEAAEQLNLRNFLQEQAKLLESTAGPLLLTNYRSALRVLNSDDWDDDTRCPTCEQIDDKSLVEALRFKISTYDQAEIKGRAVTSAWNTAAWVQRWRQLASHSEIDTASGSDPKGPESEDQESDSAVYTRLAGSFTNGSATEEALNAAITALKGLETRRRGTVGRLTSENEKLTENLPASLVTLSDRIATAKHAHEQLTRYAAVEKELSTTSYHLARRESWQSFVKQAYDDIKHAEAKWVLSREQTIATTCQQMHLAITGNSNVVPGFERPNNSSRLYLRLEDFHGLKGLSASTLLQESYCTSVAISVYLSTALLFKMKARFLVLDDVTSTFDGGHQWYLMELLRNSVSLSGNPTGLQVILLTHDSLLQKYLDKQSQDPSWRHYRLTGTPPTGSIVTNQEDVGRIRKRAANFLSSGQAEEAKPWVRQYLEQTVARIIRKCSIPVPFDYAMSEHKQQLENSFNSIEREIDLQQRANSSIMTTQQQEDAVKTLLPHLIGNMMSHYATGASANVSVMTLQRTLNDTDKLADCFGYECTCKTAGKKTFRFYKSLSQKHCEC